MTMAIPAVSATGVPAYASSASAAAASDTTQNTGPLFSGGGDQVSIRSRQALEDEATRRRLARQLGTLASPVSGAHSAFLDPGSTEGGYKATFRPDGESILECELPPGLRVSHVPETEDDLVDGPRIKFFKALREAPFIDFIFRFRAVGQ